MKDRR